MEDLRGIRSTHGLNSSHCLTPASAPSVPPPGGCGPPPHIGDPLCSGPLHAAHSGAGAASPMPPMHPAYRQPPWEQQRWYPAPGPGGIIQAPHMARQRQPSPLPGGPLPTKAQHTTGGAEFGSMLGGLPSGPHPPYGFQHPAGARDPLWQHPVQGAAPLPHGPTVHACASHFAAGPPLGGACAPPTPQGKPDRDEGAAVRAPPPKIGVTNEFKDSQTYLTVLTAMTENEDGTEHMLASERAAAVAGEQAREGARHKGRSRDGGPESSCMRSLVPCLVTCW